MTIAYSFYSLPRPKVKFVSDLRQVGGFLWVLLSSTKKTYCHDIIEILLKVATNQRSIIWYRCQSLCLFFDIPIYFSQSIGTNWSKLGRNDTGVIHNIVYDIRFIQNFNMTVRSNYAY